MSVKHTCEYIKRKSREIGFEFLSNNYKNNHTKYPFKCSLGHIFNIRWKELSKRKKCTICSNIKKSIDKTNNYDDVKRETEKDGKFILISKEYKNCKEKIKIKCLKRNHIFPIQWDNFKRRRRCPICSNIERMKKLKKRKHTYEFVKEEFEKKGWKLLSKEYINAKEKLKVLCNNGHFCEISYSNFSKGKGCKICWFERMPKEKSHDYEFIKKEFEKRGYKLLSKTYNGNKKKLKVECKNGHVYYPTYDRFKSKHGCPVCSHITSQAEKEITEYLKSLNIHIIENDRRLISPLELDIVIPSHKLAIEYCGIYWHSEKYKDKNYHKNKLEKTNEAGYRLITIFEDEWIHKKDIIKNRLKYFLGLNNERIYARKCEIREIDRETAKAFVDKHHIQGHVNSTIYLGAFYNEKTNFGFTIPKLVAVNTFVKRGLEYELNRFCVNSSIIGIASKFIKYFQRNYEWGKITTFADLRWSEGDLYEKIGFVKDKILRPDYSYFQRNELVRYHKFGFRHISMKNKLENYDPELSEHQNMLNHNYYRIYDCGKIRYIIKKLDIL